MTEYTRAIKIVEKERSMAEMIYHLMNREYHKENVLGYLEDHEMAVPDEETLNKIVERYEKYRDNDEQWAYDLRSAVLDILRETSISNL